MLAFLGSIFSGGLTGLLGVAVQRFADYQNKKLDLASDAQKFAHETDLKKADAEIMAQEWAGRLKVADTEATSADNVASAQSFSASFQMEPQRYSSPTVTSGQNWIFVILDLIRGLVRPGLTVYLCVLTTLVYMEARSLLGDGKMLTPEQALSVTQQVIATILYLTTTCVLWWFGTRNKQAPPKILQKP